ncbi:hypothetical protein ENSA5_42600 [Enhygromyxa salina]|uniref:Uncharacterized protein n=1 Tax=Enhygromyxa salina TaxID=215803 RepID=A0A2S9XLX1_9BACT|nr:hypothetical protein ENSA5_42600 [Enhygromyxa salina]
MAGQYELLDDQGQPIVEAFELGADEQTELSLPTGVYYLRGPGEGDPAPVVVASGLRLVWDGERVLAADLWEADQARVTAEAEAEAKEKARAEAEAKAEAARVEQARQDQQLAPPGDPPAPRAHGHRHNWRAWASPLASTFVPGVGQFFNGQGGKGTGLLFGTVGSLVGAAALYSLGNDGTRGLGAEYARLVGYGVLSSAAPLLWIYAITDAYRVAVDEEVEPALEHNVRLSVTRMMTVGFRADTRRPGFYDDWSVSIMGQATRRLTVGLSDLSVKPGGLDGPQVWQFGGRLDYRVFDRKRLWIDLGVGSILQVAVGSERRPLDPTLASPGTTTKFGAVPYGQIDLRYFVLDRVSLELIPRLAVPLTTRYYSAKRALPRYAPQAELGVGVSTYF